MLKLYLIRHPQPTDARGRCYGRLDLAVDTAAVQSTAAAVRAQLPKQVLQNAEIFTSPSVRCVLLARELAAPRRPRIAAALVEMSFGSWEGLPWDAIPRAELQAWANDLWRYKPGGAECAAMVAERWQRWLAEVRTSLDTAVAVTHAGVIRVALACAGQLNAQAWASAPIEFGAVYGIDCAVNRAHGAAAAEPTP
jgi:alpha-ribazole phosphatase